MYRAGLLPITQRIRLVLHVYKTLLSRFIHSRVIYTSNVKVARIRLLKTNGYNLCGCMMLLNVRKKHICISFYKLRTRLEFYKPTPKPWSSTYNFICSFILFSSLDSQRSGVVCAHARTRCRVWNMYAS